MKQIASTIVTGLVILAAGPALASLPSSQETLDEETSYGYLRTVEGPGWLVQATSGARIDVESNYPVLAGDRLEVDPGGRIELSLPDFNIVRLAGGSELVLARLALSAETEDTDTALRLLRGELQFLVHDLIAVSERPRVDTANATIYLQGSGVYRIATDGYGWTEVIVRQGFAEVATEAGSSVVRSGEQAWIEGGRWPRVDIERAGGADELERWGADLDGELAAYGEAPVEDHLAYAAAPLSRHGSWVTDDGYRAWRPAVAASWRPYEAGYWTDTPTGMVWVSNEPWAWVTYHYGSWVPSAGYGWVWRPGLRFAPAWVYWYWGPSYVAWVPVGYYSSYYGHYGRGFRFGIHGWAGGDWGYFADWTFCSTGRYRRRDLRHHLRRGHHLARDTRSRALERGLITTDSRHGSRQRAAQRGGPGRPGGDSLPDVTAFVARRRELSPEVTERVFSERRAVSRGDVWERPQAPRSGAPRARPAVPRGDGPATPDAWRRESGRLRNGVAPAERSAGPRARPVGPTDRRGESTSSWRDRPGRAAPRGATPRRPAAPGGEVRAGDAGPQGEARPPVVRRVWEGIRDRQRPRPTSPDATAGAPGRRQPVTNRGSTPSRRTPSAQPRSAPSRPTPSTQAGSRPSRRPPSTARPAEPPRRSSTERGSSPPRRSSAERSSRPQRRPPAARSNGGGSSRASSASGSRQSTGGSSKGRSARRRPPK